MAHVSWVLRGSEPPLAEDLANAGSGGEPDGSGRSPRSARRVRWLAWALPGPCEAPELLLLTAKSLKIHG